VSCYVCGTEMVSEEHHLRHQAQGGTRGDTIMLCSNCHDMVHKQARVAKSTNAKTRRQNYIPAELHTRAMAVVNELLAGEASYKMEQEHYQDHAMQTLQIAISPRQMQRLHMLKQQNGFSNLADFTESIIAKLTGVRSWHKSMPALNRPPSQGEPNKP
jgi:hypothetical protein